MGLHVLALHLGKNFVEVQFVKYRRIIYCEEGTSLILPGSSLLSRALSLFDL